VIVVPRDLLPRAGNTAEAFKFNGVVLHSGTLVEMRFLLLHSASKVCRIKQVPTTNIENPFVWRRTFPRRVAADSEETFAAHKCHTELR